MSRLVIVWFPDWETNALVIDSPPGAAAALICTKGRITHATREARAVGVEPGMRRSLAQYLCPDLVIVPDDPTRNGRSFNVVLEALDTVSAMVCAIRPGIAWMPASVAKMYGSEDALCERIIDAVAQQAGSECYVGVGQGVLNAWVAALHGVIDPTPLQVGQLKLSYLKPLLEGSPVDVEETFEALSLMGMHTVSDLQNTDTTRLLSRFGMVGQSLQRLLGQSEPLSRFDRVEDEAIEQSVDFPIPVTEISVVLGYLLNQANQLVQRLVARQVAPTAVDISATMVTPKGEITRLRRWAIIDFPTPKDLVDRTRWQVQAWVDEIIRQHQSRTQDLVYEDGQETFGVVKVVLNACQLVPIDDLAQHLWGQRSKEDVRSASTAFRLQSIVGVEGVKQPRVRGGFDPISRAVESTWGAVAGKALWEDWKLPAHLNGHASFQLAQQWEGQLPAPSPATVLDHPVIANLFDEVGNAVRLRPDATLNATVCSLSLETQAEEENLTLDLSSLAGGVLSHFASGQTLAIRRVQGPWPVLGRWWSQVERQSDGSRAWLIVQPTQGPDMLVGWFAKQWKVAALWV